MTRTRRSRDTQENRDARKAALVAYGTYGQTLNLKDLEAFRLAAERWRETAAETRDEEEWRRAKRFTRIAHQLTQLYTRRVFT